MYFNVAVQQSNAMSVAKDISSNEHKTKKDKQADTHTHTHKDSQQGRQAVYQSRSGDRLFGAGDHIGLVVDLEGQSGQTGRQVGQGRRDKAQCPKMQAAAVEEKVERCA